MVSLIHFQRYDNYWVSPSYFYFSQDAKRQIEREIEAEGGH